MVHIGKINHIYELYLSSNVFESLAGGNQISDGQVQGKGASGRIGRPNPHVRSDGTSPSADNKQTATAVVRSAR